ncbi:hypothetical protein [Jingyaoa shaoxingensis]|uniref:Uncharacterized protein n=1 Tax=Jingyaoa shaoxingensis TaxID=2763671 RepID=A0ABR7NCR6_9FIRM|nr:hypothetical protein [Jingyaoa shaoxingensis]MBC8573642.1 hypothetical protein [Jingyaoa shaoxingensis]
MKKPESLNTITVAQTREKYRNNQKSLDNMMYLVATGIYEEIKGIAGESIINQVMTEILVQQEYIREREKANWGWDKESVDFSKHKDRIA